MKLEFDLKVQLVHKQKASGLMLSGWGMKEGKREVFGEGEVEKKKHCSYEKLGHTDWLLLPATPAGSDSALSTRAQVEVPTHFPKDFWFPVFPGSRHSSITLHNPGRHRQALR